jgi:hypothetical protein
MTKKLKPWEAERKRIRDRVRRLTPLEAYDAGWQAGYDAGHGAGFDAGLEECGVDESTMRSAATKTETGTRCAEQAKNVNG